MSYSESNKIRFGTKYSVQAVRIKNYVTVISYLGYQESKSIYPIIFDDIRKYNEIEFRARLEQLYKSDFIESGGLITKLIEASCKAISEILNVDA